MRTLILILCLLTQSFVLAQRPQPIVFQQQPTGLRPLSIRQQTLVYQQPIADTQAPFPTIRQKRFSARSQVHLGKIENELDQSTSLVWLQFQLVNAHPTDTLQLWYWPGVHSLITLYDSTGNLLATGGLCATGEGNQAALPLRVLPRTSQRYYIRLLDYIRIIITESDLLFSPQAYQWERTQLYQRDRWLLILMAMFVGCFLFMGVYSLFQYYFKQDTAYFYYALYAEAALLHILKLANSRLGLGLAPASMPQLLSPSLGSLAFSVSFFYALFLSKLLALPRQQPTVWQLTRILMGLLIVQQGVALRDIVQGQPWLTNNAYYLFSEVSCVGLGLLLIVAIVRSDSPLKPYLLAGSLSLFLLGISPLYGFYFFADASPAFLVFANYPPFSMALGFVIELFCFALALAYRNRLIELENQSLHATYTQQLEGQLIQRTQEIQAQTQQLAQQQTRQLELNFAQKLAETEMTALRAQMNPHFIFNCLNSIKLYATENEATKAADYLTKFARLIRLVLENSRSDSVTLQNELDALQLYLEMEAMRFKDKLRFQLILQAGLDPAFVEIPPLLLQPYVENAIWHGLMHKHEGGTVVVRIEQIRTETLRITITDDGIGRALAGELKSKSAMPNKSFGMKVTGERIALINQVYQTHTHVQVHDMRDEEGHPVGTEVVLEIPI